MLAKKHYSKKVIEDVSVVIEYELLSEKNGGGIILTTSGGREIIRSKFPIYTCVYEALGSHF